MTDRPNTWEQYEKLVLDKLDDHGKTLKNIHDEVIRLQIEMGVVKTKLALIGAASGGASAVVTTVLVNLLVK
jgi:hypothetical protein